MTKTDSSKSNVFSSRFKRGLYLTIGTASLTIGGIGIFLPIVPTTPFLLLSAACYYKSSKSMHHWMLNNRWFGNYLRNYADGRGLSLRAKLFTISLLWALILYSAYFAMTNLVVQIALLSIATAVTIHIMKLPTFRNTIFM